MEQQASRFALPSQEAVKYWKGLLELVLLLLALPWILSHFFRNPSRAVTDSGYLG